MMSFDQWVDRTAKRDWFTLDLKARKEIRDQLKVKRNRNDKRWSEVSSKVKSHMRDEVRWRVLFQLEEWERREL